MALQPRQRLQGGGLSVSGRQTNKGYYNAQRISGAVAQRQARAVQDAGNAFTSYLDEREARIGREDTARATNDAIGATDEQIIQRSQNQAESAKYREANEQVYLARQLGTLKQELAQERIRLQSENLTGEEARQRLDAYASDFINTNEYMKGMDPNILASTFTEPLLNYNSQQSDKYLEWSIQENRAQVYEGAQTNLAINLDTTLSQASTPSEGVMAASVLVQDTVDNLVKLDYSHSAANEVGVSTVIQYALDNNNEQYLDILKDVKAGAHSLADRPAVRDKINKARKDIRDEKIREDARLTQAAANEKKTQINSVYGELTTKLVEDPNADVRSFAKQLVGMGGSTAEVNAVFTIADNFRDEGTKLVSTETNGTYVDMMTSALSGRLTNVDVSNAFDGSLITGTQAVSLMNTIANPTQLKSALKDPRLSVSISRMDALLSDPVVKFEASQLAALTRMRAGYYDLVRARLGEDGRLDSEDVKMINDYVDQNAGVLGLIGGVPSLESTGEGEEPTPTPRDEWVPIDAGDNAEGTMARNSDGLQIIVRDGKWELM